MPRKNAPEVFYDEKKRLYRKRIKNPNTNKWTSVYGKTKEECRKKAKQKIESFAESRLYDKEGQLGARFVLDSSFGWCTQKEQAEIQEKQFNMWLKEQEFDLKQKLATMGEDTNGLEIRIVRKGE